MSPAAFDDSVTVTKLSITAPRIELLCKRGRTLATASAAFYRGIDGQYIVTNWHNLAGVNPLTGKMMPGLSEYPFRVRIIGRQMRDAIYNVPFEIEIDLCDVASGKFVWRQHPTLGKNVDIGALKINDLHPLSISCCNDDIMTNEVVRGPGDEVFILGYPLRINGGHNYPLWKRGSIASEPSQHINGLPMYLVDCASRRGMSGAPVFFRSHVYLTNAQQLSVGHTAQLFYGIYSGRLPETGDNPDDPMAAQIGIVWKPEAVYQVVNFGVPPEL